MNAVQVRERAIGEAGGGSGTPAPPAGRSSGIDGIRALAVAAVVVYHLNPQWLPGGFAGVDVFFVVSGYLITNLLVAERERSGSLGLRRFWVRRARRLLPALLLVLLAVSASVGFLGEEAHARLRASVIAALTYTSNWWQIDTHEAYFSEFGIPAPLRHLWSLAVEEQFYLLWPLLLIMIMWLPGRRTRVLACGLAAISSAVLMGIHYVPGADPSRVYYGTDTHAFGLLIGATLALAVPLSRLQGRRRRLVSSADAAGGLGLTFLVVAACYCSGQDAITYRGGLAAVCLATAALLIAAATPGLTQRVLSLSPLRWLGVRSYGIYLWHWPVITVGAAITGGPPTSIASIATLTGVTVALAAASWRWLEEPILRQGVRGTLRRWAGQLRGLVSPYATTERRVAVVGLAAALAATSSCAAIGLARSPDNGGTDIAQQIADGEESAAQSRQEDVPAAPSPSATVPAGAESRRSRLTRCLAHPPGKDVTAIGDSVMLAAARQLRTRLSGITIDAKVGRQMSDAPKVIRDLRSDGRLRSTVVLGLGTNGPFPPGTLAHALSSIGDSRQTLLINTRDPRTWEGQVNQALRRAARADSTVHLADWHSISGRSPRALWTDRTHPRPAGARSYANLISTTICEAKY